MLHRPGLLVLTFVGGFVALLALLLVLGGSALPVRAGPGDLYVASGGDCGGATPCYDSVQAAVDAAVEGDVIKMAQGTYTGVSARDGVTQVVYISKTITVRGGYAITDWSVSHPLTQPTTLDAQGQGRVLYISGDIAPLIEGLRITGGRADGASGGGVYIDRATATIRDSVVFSNTAQDGGGLVLYRSDAALHGNVISGNVAAGRGGGVSVVQGEAQIDGNTVVANEAGRGGGLRLYMGHDTLANNVVADNRASVWGSGLYIEDSSAHLMHNTIARNLGGDGVGLYVQWQLPFFLAAQA